MNEHARTLRQLMASEDPVMAPGAFSPIVGRLIAEAGFKACYVTGAGVAGGLYGQPDVGLVTMTELVDAARRTVECSGLPVICDADTGFGGVLNVSRTVRELEAAGVAALHIEDQEFPRRCGFLGGHVLSSKEDMGARLKAALDARRHSETIIIARTEMFGAQSLDETIDRACSYAELGVDLIFCNGVTTVEHAERLARAIPAPQLYNVSTSGLSPHLSEVHLRELGYKLVIYPAQSLFLALRSVQEMLSSLKKDGTLEPWLDRMIDFQEWKRVSGILEADETERRYL